MRRGWNFSLYQFQSTPPRREVTGPLVESGDGTVISIHTSPKGGDLQAHGLMERSDISIHTSPKGGDSALRGWSSRPENFNPHLPEGR